MAISVYASQKGCARRLSSKRAKRRMANSAWDQHRYALPKRPGGRTSVADEVTASLDSRRG